MRTIPGVVTPVRRHDTRRDRPQRMAKWHALERKRQRDAGGGSGKHRRSRVNNRPASTSSASEAHPERWCEDAVSARGRYLAPSGTFDARRRGEGRSGNEADRKSATPLIQVIVRSARRGTLGELNTQIVGRPGRENPKRSKLAARTHRSGGTEAGSHPPKRPGNVHNVAGIAPRTGNKSRTNPMDG